MKSRNFFQALVFERDGDMNLGQVFTLLMGAAGTFGFIYILLHSMSVVAIVASYTWLGGAFGAVLIAGVPIARAKILANAKMPGELAKAIADVGLTDPGVSSDIQELRERQQQKADEVG